MTLAEDPVRAGDVPAELVPALVLRLAGILAALSVRSAVPESDRPADDTLLDVTEAARRLAVSRDWVYRHGKTLPFAVRVGHRHLRFSARGLERWLRMRQSR